MALQAACMRAQGGLVGLDAHIRDGLGFVNGAFVFGAAAALGDTATGRQGRARRQGAPGRLHASTGFQGKAF
jgi:hypothetical protein